MDLVKCTKAFFSKYEHLKILISFLKHLIKSFERQSSFFSYSNNYSFSPHLLFHNNFVHVLRADIKTDATAEALLQLHHSFQRHVFP